jgi:hypothetical protein
MLSQRENASELMKMPLKMAGLPRTLGKSWTLKVSLHALEM